MSAWICTSTGKWIDLQACNAGYIDVRDIARGLAAAPRWRGQTGVHFSVAQHSVMVSLHVPERHAFAALLHDAEEAYHGDQPTPFKEILPESITRLWDWMRRDIFDTFGVPFPVDQVVKKEDGRAAKTEWRDLFLPMEMEPRPGAPITFQYGPQDESVEPWPEEIVALTTEEALDAWLERFLDLCPGSNRQYQRAYDLLFHETLVK